MEQGIGYGGTPKYMGLSKPGAFSAFFRQYWRGMHPRKKWGATVDPTQVEAVVLPLRQAAGAAVWCLHKGTDRLGQYITCHCELHVFLCMSVPAWYPFR